MSPNYPRPLLREQFYIAVICAKRIETNAVEAMFDEHWEPESTYGKAPGDTNAYHLGRIGSHNVVLGYLPGSGTAISATSASNFRSSFTSIRLGLVVGICGGVPTIHGRNSITTEVLLGDVIISTQLAEYRHGTQRPDGFFEKETLPKASIEIRSFLGKMEGDYSYIKLQNRTSTHLSTLLKKEFYKNWKYPGADRDRLYSPSHRHKHQQRHICEICDKDEDRVCEATLESSCETLGCREVVRRDRLVEPKESSARVLARTAEESAQVWEPELLIHFGPVASGDLVMKSGLNRNEVVSKERFFKQKVIAFEMEGAGVWETLPTIVIKGVSDYADSHKGDEWQQYAAARAAACMKAILEQWTQTDNELASIYTPSNQCEWSTPAEASAYPFDSS